MEDSTKHVEKTTASLKAGGFVHVGHWEVEQTTGSIIFKGDQPLPRDAGVYAYAINGIVHYVGSAQKGLKGRLRHYEISKRLRTAHRIRQEILSMLAAGSLVEVWTIVPPGIEIKGLPIDMVVGLEEGLIRSWRPIWNRRGMGKMRVSKALRGTKPSKAT